MAKAITDLPADTNLVASDQTLITDVTNNVSKSVRLDILMSAKLGIYPRFSAYASTAGTAAANTWSKMLFDTKEFDQLTNFASSRFTATVPGDYTFSAAGEVTANALESYTIALYKNGTEYKRGTKGAIPGSGVSTASFTVSASCVRLAAGDYVEAYYFNNSGGGKALTAGINLTYFNGAMLSMN